MSKHFFNTTNETGETLKSHEEKALSQEKQVIELAKGLETFTPWEIFDRYPRPKPPIGSVRRAITLLKKEGKFSFTGRRRKSRHNPHQRTERVLS